MLRPLAEPARHPGAFHRGYRLLAFDGTRFNLRNTPAINAEAIKQRGNKGDGVPAFAHLLGVVLVELGLHQPLAAAFGWQGEGDLIGPEALAQWIERILDDLQTSAVIQKRKPRSCPRTLRQPIKNWLKTKIASSRPLLKTIVFTNP